jgi:DNA-binding transcriptional ArsR family regulator
MERNVFAALADPTRRAIMLMLATQSLTMNQVSAQFSTSRPAISKHVKILVQHGLVDVKPVGRERVCVARPDALLEVDAWIQGFRLAWASRLDALERFLDNQAASLPTDSLS